MRKMVMGALAVAGAVSLALGTGLSAQVTQEQATDKAELRVFVFDKAGKAVDVSKWTGAIDVTPENGKRKAFKLEPASSATMEGVKEGARELKEGVKEGAKELKEGVQGEGRQEPKRATESRQPMLCGQVKELDDWYVELVVVQPGMTSPVKKGDESKTPGTPQQDGKTWTKGFDHSHGGAYFKAQPEFAWLQDPKSRVVNFDATIVFTLPNGDTKYVKGFEYPEGVYNDALGRILDTDLKDTDKLDHEGAATTAQKIQAALQALPPLAFESDGDRQEFEKAKQECMAACHRMEQATGKDIGDAADKCKSSLKELRSQAKDAMGAKLSAE